MRPTSDVFWLTAFIDVPEGDHAATVAFWSAVSGYDASPARGEHGEFLSLVPSDGDDHLRVQRLGDPPARIHLDVHVPDPRSAASAVVTAGATEVADLGHVVMRSPGGLPFCFVAHGASRRAAPRDRGGVVSAVDQVCIDVDEADRAAEESFWADLLGVDAEAAGAEFTRLHTPATLPLRILVQARAEPSGPTTAHLDLSATDRTAEVERHAALGAQVVDVRQEWTVLRDPAGSVYCVTDRNPVDARWTAV